jgi:glycosyltransferase involved in cell wall biosynthesis
VLPHDTGNNYFLQYRIIYHLVDGIIVHANQSKNDIKKNFNIRNEKIFVIPHGLLEIAALKIQNNKNDKLIFSMIGVLGYYKGIDILLEAWTKNDKILNNNSIHLIIAGQGKIEIDEKYLNRNITIINRLLSDEEFEEIVNKTDVGILPYRNISQSGVLLTLLAAHKPVIVSDCGGLVQPFEVGKVGWILDTLSSEKLAEQISAIAINPNMAIEIQNNAKLWEDVASFYSWKCIGDLTFNLYKKVLNVLL